MNLQSAIPTILPVTAHTDHIGEGSTFVVIKGFKQNGIDFIPDALQKGANKIVVQNDMDLPDEIINLIKLNNAELLHASNSRQALTELSAQAWQYPAKKLKIIGITGTKGKTTSTFLMHHLLTKAGFKTAMISGVYNIINGEKYLASLTTPLPDYLHAFFYKCVQEQVQYVVMESSAQAFTCKRLYGIEFSGAIFTNFDLEHMEDYKDMEEYFQAKCEIFKQLNGNASIVLNIDNDWIEKVQSNKNSSTLSFCKDKQSDFSVDIKKNDMTGLGLIIKTKGSEFDFCCPNLIGDFNAYNVSCTIALCLQLGIDPKIISDGLLSFALVPGRMESYALSNGALAIVDYAHNPSSFSYVLPTMKKMAKKLIVVFGAGGERYKQKRPMMGAIASSIADHVIVTCDNPRSENLQDIIDQILEGITSENKHKVICQADRAKAINEAYKLSSNGDVIAILGKGPDEYQHIGDKKIYFSDRETIIKCDKNNNAQ